MQKEELFASTHRRFCICTTDSNHSLPVAENTVNRGFRRDRPNEVWVSDLTAMRCVVRPDDEAKCPGVKRDRFPNIVGTLQRLALTCGREKLFFGHLWVLPLAPTTTFFENGSIGGADCTTSVRPTTKVTTGGAADSRDTRRSETSSISFFYCRDSWTLLALAPISN